MISLFKKEDKYICKVCKKQFELKKENKYIATENKGLSSITTGIRNYECFDCPYCGCQNIVNIREGAYENDRRDKEN